MKCLSTMFVLLFCLLPAAAYLVLAASDENNGGATMERSALAEKKMLELFGNVQSSLEATDPDFIAMLSTSVWRNMRGRDLWMTR